ncbi:MAG TPA: secretin N-terminal domain-containing protein [Drouetiella sp.]
MKFTIFCFISSVSAALTWSLFASPTLSQETISASKPNLVSPTINPFEKANDTRAPFKLIAEQHIIHNLRLRNTPVREVIAELAERGNLNVVIDKSVAGTVTANLKDVTLNEAMDYVLASSGLQARSLDKHTVLVAPLPTFVVLGLNRPKVRTFKLNYANPVEVANILQSSIFNKGVVPDFLSTVRRRSSSESAGENEGNSPDQTSTSSLNAPLTGNQIEKESASSSEVVQLDQGMKQDQPKTLRGSTRITTQEGVGFNNGATDPGSQQIRAFQAIGTDYQVEQNGGGPVVVPDVRNHQVIVLGTADEVALAERAIQSIDQRPKQVHIQASMVELTNQGIRQLGATLNLQGQGASSSIMGNSNAPTNTAASPFTGLIGTLLPSTTTTIAGVTAANTAQSALNFLTLSQAAGGSANISTFPKALNVTLNVLLQTNKAKLVANPSVVVVDDTEALITIASEVIHKVTSTTSLGVVSTNVELTKAGIFLNVLPRISDDGFITMRLRPQVSTPLGAPQTFGSTSNPTIVTLLNVRDLMTQQVRIKDGQTLVLGGLFTENEAAQIAKFPYLAETPVLGALFRNTLKGRSRTELMLLITAKIVEDEQPQAMADAPKPLPQ